MIGVDPAAMTIARAVSVRAVLPFLTSTDHGEMILA